MIVLVVNCGSSTLRTQLLDASSGKVFARSLVERIGAVTSIANMEAVGEEPRRESLKAPTHREALQFVLDFMTTLAIGDMKDAPISAVGHRVVHGGEVFKKSVLIDQDCIASIRDAFDLAPLHNPANLEGILAARELLPDVPHIAVFDTAFHQSIPPQAYLYAIPHRLYRLHGIRRYGFHGTSHLFISRRAAELAGGQAPSRLISCHLGNGCSVTAIRDGQSVDTSMGLTPLAGLVMGTRCGDIDPSLVFYLMEKEGYSLAEVHALLNRHSGLLGLSGYDSDMRRVLTEADRGDERCRDAINVFCYRIKSYIGQYAGVLNGCDTLVFTGGIGENSAMIREKSLQGLDYLGVQLDPDLNQDGDRRERIISTPGSKVAVWVIPTNEELVIARDAMALAG
jgi:acetate kinase